MSMLKRLLIPLSAVCLLVSCGDECSSNASTQPEFVESNFSLEQEVESSSSVKSRGSSGSAKIEEFSSPTVSDKSSSSMKNGGSSSSAKTEESSSSEIVNESSSSLKTGASSSSGITIELSSSVIVEESSSSVLSSSSMNSIYDAENKTLTDLRDNQVYKTVTIGEQIWMAENLNYETDVGSYCYGDSAEYCKKYGRLYTWATAVGKPENECGFGKRYCDLGEGNVRGVCPAGWHLPSMFEWETLFFAVGRQALAGTMLKSTEGWEDKDDGTSGNGSDDFGFSALPAGSGFNDGNYSALAFSACFWSSTEVTSNYAFSVYAFGMYLRNGYDDGNLNNFSKNDAFSVRCLKD